MSLPGYDTWKTGPYGRFETAMHQASEAFAIILSDRDNELRTNPLELDEAFSEATNGITNPNMHKRFVAILEAAAQHRQVEEIGQALHRLVNDIIERDAERFAEEAIR